MGFDCPGRTGGLIAFSPSGTVSSLYFFRRLLRPVDLQALRRRRSSRNRFRATTAFLGLHLVVYRIHKGRSSSVNEAHHSGGRLFTLSFNGVLDVSGGYPQKGAVKTNEPLPSPSSSSGVCH